MVLLLFDCVVLNKFVPDYVVFSSRSDEVFWFSDLFAEYVREFQVVLFVNGEELVLLGRSYIAGVFHDILFLLYILYFSIND